MYEYQIIDSADMESVEYRMNKLAEDGWRLIKFCTVYDHETEQMVYTAVMGKGDDARASA